MQRYRKKDLLETLSYMEKLNNAIMKSSNPGAGIGVDVLTQCQELAIEMGTFLEESGDAYAHIVKLLETYCEDIYQMCMELNNSIQCKRIAGKLKGVLIKLNNKLRQDIPEDKKEVVFLPYKASMWDSLESVWKAASEDPLCDAYVVPVPYYDRNPDGSFGEMHYEGREYPDYVPIASWKEYIIAERRPDVIYIHNPYDDCNYVTSVHPAFYSYELRKHTDMLVYIPYFVAINDNVERHFCTTSGVLYAHKVIVQSEKTREIYIEELHKYEEENNCKGALGNIEEKIVAGGSPKFDKVMSAKLEDFEIPEEWNRLIIKPDGSRKKVILYNTTIESMLVDTERMLDKIEDSLKVFRDNPEVVLLWRPHPLLKETLKSMRRIFFDRYERIEREYVQGGWGIYDDSAEVYRAITLSDAYYGDWSSVVELYKNSNKPILIQNIKKRNLDIH